MAVKHALPALFVGARRWLLVQLIANGFAQGVMAFAAALAVRNIVDQHLLHALVGAIPLSLSAAMLFAVAVVSAGLRWRESVDAERLGQDYALALRGRLLEHVTRLPPRVLGRRRRGGLFLRFVSDLTAIRQWISLGIARLTVAALMISVTLVLLAVLNAYLALVVLLAVVFGAVLTVLLGPPMESAVRQARRQRALLAGHVGETLAGMAGIQVFGRRWRMLQRLARRARRLRDAVIAQANVTGALQAIALLTAAWASAGALVLGVWIVRSGGASAGDVIAAMSVVALLVAPIRNLGRTYAYWRSAQVAREKVRTLLALGPAIRSPRGAPMLRIAGAEIVFDAVSVRGSLHDVSARVPAGSRVAVVGANGAGKSTLLSLVGRLLDPDSGTVRIDGQDVSAVNLNSLRRAIGWVSPDLPLYRGSVEHNVRFRKSSVSADAFAVVCQRCGLDRMAAQWPAGLRSRIGEGGNNLSTGERYRIMLARALLGEPQILILDEADANLDSDSRAILDHVIAEFPGTVMLATHRDDVSIRVDWLWHMDNGRLTAVQATSKNSAGVTLLAQARIDHGERSK
ncbi:MAG: ABC transporter ATP-binding protein [Xanthomonadaceae bacterium]|nr:ABC transporter ATP-binding protein [Xanthomonadaceae bacterium]MDP2187018.1 ABC transporter ATP-binding protein [Xanthomonadales bacterium]MDZ4117440.1 ABC transporter ATP-binding protein [Xanthomonadaceae bacterium]MDZ4379648.1 ABC transporter ATP-binding protein [Xanthomonadaceae bacterium]